MSNTNHTALSPEYNRPPGASPAPDRGEFERARTWMLEIAAAAASGVETTDGAPSAGFLQRRTAHQPTNRCVVLPCGRPGGYAVGLIDSFKSCSKAESVAWVKAFLANHPAPAPPLEKMVLSAESAVNKLRAEKLGSAVSVSGTPGEDYLRSAASLRRIRRSLASWQKLDTARAR